MWRVEAINAIVAAELDALPNDMLARLKRISELIQAHGLERMREPHVKHLEGRLWEMRLSGRAGIARAIHVTATGRRVVILRAFVKKTQATPQHEIRLARQRAKEIA
jgi:phage-related protein